MSETTPRSPLRCFMVCVDFADILSITLPYNLHHFREVYVVTAHHDEETLKVCDKYGVKMLATDAFYRDGAHFNKWLALEEGLDTFGRHGWVCLQDVDILWPRNVRVEDHGDFLTFDGPISENVRDDIAPFASRVFLPSGYLFSPLRRMLESFPGPYHHDFGMEHYPPEDEWCNLRIHPNVNEWAGYCQIFHSSDPHLPSPPPWHEVDWKHAGGADSFFQARWPGDCKMRPGWQVLHLGKAGENWCGRVTTYTDGSKPDGHNIRRELTRSLIVGRRGKWGEERFSHEKLK